MTTLAFYFVWRFMLDKDSDAAPFGAVTSLIDGLLLVVLIVKLNE